MYDPNDLYNQPPPNSADLSELRCENCGMRVLDSEGQLRSKVVTAAAEPPRDGVVHARCLTDAFVWQRPWWRRQFEAMKG